MHPFGVVCELISMMNCSFHCWESVYLCVCVCCHRQQAARSHLSGLYHPASGATVLTVPRLKHPVSFPASLAPPVREKEKAEI